MRGTKRFIPVVFAIFCFVLVNFTYSSAQVTDTLELVRYFGGVKFCMAVRDPYVYVGCGSRMEILQRVGTSFQEMNTLRLPNDVRDLFIQGSYLYAAGENFLEILDISSPGSPYSVGRFEAEEGLRVRDIFVSGSYAYLAAGRDGLHILDVSDPSNPSRVYSLVVDTLNIRGVFVQEGILYVLYQTSSDKRYLKLLDLTDPANPQERGACEVDGTFGIYVKGTYAYVANGWSESGFHVIDVSNPDDPVIKTTVDGIDAHSIIVDSIYAYVAGDGRNGLMSFDVSDPENPAFLDSLQAVEGSFLYLEGSFIYCARYFADIDIAFHVVDVSNPSDLTLYATRVEPTVIQGEWNVGDTCLYLWTINEIWAYDITDGENPVPITHFPAGGVMLMTSYGNRLYTFDWDNYVHTYDISDPQHINELGSFKLSSRVTSFWALRNLLYVLMDGDLKIYDVSNPSNFSELGSLEVSWTNDLYVDTRRAVAYIACVENKMKIVDVSDSTAPRLISTISTPGEVRCLWVWEDSLYGAVNYGQFPDYTFKIMGFDVSDISQPSFAGETALDTGMVSDINVQDGTIFTAVVQFGAALSSKSLLNSENYRQYLEFLGLGEKIQEPEASSLFRRWMGEINARGGVYTYRTGTFKSGARYSSKSSSEVAWSIAIKRTRTGRKYVYGSLSSGGGYVLGYQKGGPCCLVTGISPPEAAAAGCAVSPRYTSGKCGSEVTVQVVREASPWNFKEWVGASPPNAKVAQATMNGRFPNCTQVVARFVAPILSITPSGSDRHLCPCNPLIDTVRVFPFVLSANDVAKWHVGSITFQAAGSGNDKDDIREVRLYCGSELLDQGQYTADDGQITLHVGRDIEAGGSLSLLVVYQFNRDRLCTDSTGAPVAKSFRLLTKAGWVDAEPVQPAYPNYGKQPVHPTPIWSPVTVVAPVWNVNTRKPFATIQDAVRDADTRDGHVIEVCRGTYTENVVLDKSLTLRSSEGYSVTTIQAKDRDLPTIWIKKSNTVVQGFTVTGSSYAGLLVGAFEGGPRLTEITIYQNKIVDNYMGVWADSVHALTLRDNRIASNQLDGVRLVDPFGANRIVDNSIERNGGSGIKLLGPVERRYFTPDTLSLNRIRNNDKAGIAAEYPCPVIVSNNWIEENDSTGISMLEAYLFRIRDNRFKGNRRQDIFLWICFGDTTGTDTTIGPNRFYGNSDTTLFMIGCRHITVIGNDTMRAPDGIALYDSIGRSNLYTGNVIDGRCRLGQCRDATFSGNYLSQTSDLTLWWGEYCVVSSNNLANAGLIRVQKGFNNLVASNRMVGGVEATESRKIVIEHNEIFVSTQGGPSRLGIWVDRCDSSRVSWNREAEESLGGPPSIVVKRSNDFKINDNVATSIEVHSCRNCTIFRNAVGEIKLMGETSETTVEQNRGMPYSDEPGWMGPAIHIGPLASSCLVEGNEIDNVRGNGISVEGQNNCVRSNTIRHFTGIGISLERSSGHNIVERNLICDAVPGNVGHHVGRGMWVDGCAKNVVRYNCITRCTNGAWLSNHVLFEKNTVTYNKADGIVVWGRNTDVASNKIKSNGGVGAHVHQYACCCKIRSNLFVSNGKSGLVIDEGARKISVWGNLYFMNGSILGLAKGIAPVASGGTGIRVIGSAPEIVGNVISHDYHDGIVCEHGARPIITLNNIHDNRGYGLVNLDTSVTIFAPSNWWGDPSGPSGAGPGSGDEVSPGVDFSDWAGERIALLVRATEDTLFVPLGGTDSLVCLFQNWDNPGDVLTVEVVADSASWLVSPEQMTVALAGDSTGADTSLIFSIPAGTSLSAQSWVRVRATSTSNSALTAVDSFLVMPYERYMASLRIRPRQPLVRTCRQVRLVAEASDPVGNPMDAHVIWQASGGTIDSTGLYTAPCDTGTFWVWATDTTAGLTDSVQVRVLPYLDRIEISPDSAEVAIGDTLQFVAQGYDSLGNPVEVYPQWAATGGRIGRRTGLFVAGPDTGWFAIYVRDSLATEVRAEVAVHIVQTSSGILHRTNGEIPKRFFLLQNYPNPFNAGTVVTFGVKETCHVKLKIYDVLGREVKVLIDKPCKPGVYEVQINAQDLSSGVYFYRIEMGDFRDVKKMVILK